MSKNYQKAASGWLYALAAVIAGTCFSATPAQSATCFLPSGECSTGKIGAGPSGGESTPEYCVGYDITEKEYNAKYNNACWDCSDSCVKTSGGTFYKCKTVNNTTWYDKYNVCCTDGTKYDKDDGKCCAGGKCDHPCSGGKQWSPTLKQCVCPSNVETDGNGNCCASGQVLDENKNCTTPCTPKDCSSYPYTSDPGNSEKCDLGCNKGTRYKCKSGYTYSGGKCVVIPACVPQTCGDDYKYVKSAFTSMENTKECNPGCGETVKYKCADGYTFTADSSSRYCKKDTPDCDGITRFTSVTDMAMNMNKICQGGVIAHDDKCYYCGKSCAQKFSGSVTSCNANETPTRVGQDDAGTQCYKCTKAADNGTECVKTLTNGSIDNGSTVYYYGDETPYLANSCAAKMTLKVACKYFTDGSQNHSSQRVYVLYINGAHNSENPSRPDLIRGDIIEYSNSFMTCSGCANTTCTFKYGGNKVSVSTVFEWGGNYTMSGGYYQIK